MSWLLALGGFGGASVGKGVYRTAVRWSVRLTYVLLKGIGATSKSHRAWAESNVFAETQAMNITTAIMVRKMDERTDAQGTLPNRSYS